MEKRGSALIGIGIGVGENRATEAARQAVASPLLETSISGATDAIINVTGGNNLTLFEVEEAAEVIRSSANTDINTIFGAVINENLNDEIIVTVIATGFEDNKEPLYHTYSSGNNVKVEAPKENIQPKPTREATRQTIPAFDTNVNDDNDDDDDDIIPSFLRKRGSF